MKKYEIPQYVDREYVARRFFNEMCGRDIVPVGNDKFGLFVTVNYCITDESITDQKLEQLGIQREKVFDTSKKGNKLPSLKINNLEEFMDRLYEYTCLFNETNNKWTSPWDVEELMGMIDWATLTLWTNASVRDFENPNEFISRYISFLKEGQLICKDGNKQVGSFGSIELYRDVISNGHEMETPYAYTLFAKRKGEMEKQLPSIIYGISGNTAYVYAIQQLERTGETDETDEEIQQLRRLCRSGVTKLGREVEALGIISLMSFFNEVKEEGIEQIVVSGALVLRDDAAVRQWEYANQKEIAQKKAEIHDRFNRLRQLAPLRIARYHSRGIELREVPEDTKGDVSLGISEFEIGEKLSEVFEIRAKDINGEVKLDDRLSEI